MDVKGLIGSYVCAEQPGEFRWQPGSLTQVNFDFEWTSGQCDGVMCTPFWVYYFLSGVCIIV